MFSRFPSLQQNASMLDALQRQQVRTAKLQKEVSTGRGVHTASDNPAAMRTILLSNSQLARLDADQQTLTQARHVLNVSNSTLLEVQNLLVQAKGLAIEGRQTVDPQDRERMAEQVGSILTQLTALTKTQVDGRYIFAGANGTAQPYASSQSAYQGSSLAGYSLLSDGSALKTHYPGSEIFTSGKSGTLLVQGTTGLSAGTGTSTLSGGTSVAIRHTSTVYAAGSGVSPGVNSAAGDTIIGPSGRHSLTVRDTSGNGTAGVISLNGGPEVAYTAGDTNLEIIGPQGERVYLDTTTITPGFDGSVDIVSNGTIAVEPGGTATPITFGANQVVTGANSKGILHLDTSNVTRVGSDSVYPQSGSDLFSTLEQLQNDLKNGRNLSSTDLDFALGQHLGALDQNTNSLLEKIGEQAVALSQIDHREDRLNDLKLATETQLTDTEGVDFASSIIKLQEEQNQFQYTLAAISRVASISILDFL